MTAHSVLYQKELLPDNSFESDTVNHSQKTTFTLNNIYKKPPKKSSHCPHGEILIVLEGGWFWWSGGVKGMHFN